MISQLKMGLLGLGLSAVLAVAGCQTNEAPAQASHEMSDMAMHCDKCQVTYVKTSYGKPGHAGVGFYETPKMACADCEDHYSNFFKTGKLVEHSCKSCGGNMTPCEKH